MERKIQIVFQFFHVWTRMREEDGRKRGHFLEGATPWRTRDLSLVSSLETLLTEMSVLRAEPGRETLSGVWCEDGRLNFTLVTRNNAPLHHLRILSRSCAKMEPRLHRNMNISGNIVVTLLAEKENYFKLFIPIDKFLLDDLGWGANSIESNS